MPPIAMPVAVGAWLPQSPQPSHLHPQQQSETTPHPPLPPGAPLRAKFPVDPALLLRRAKKAAASARRKEARGEREGQAGAGAGAATAVAAAVVADGTALSARGSHSRPLTGGSRRPQSLGAFEPSFTVPLERFTPSYEEAMARATAASLAQWGEGEAAHAAAAVAAGGAAPPASSSAFSSSSYRRMHDPSLTEAGARAAHTVSLLIPGSTLRPTSAYGRVRLKKAVSRPSRPATASASSATHPAGTRPPREEPHPTLRGFVSDDKQPPPVPNISASPSTQSLRSGDDLGGGAHCSPPQQDGPPSPSRHASATESPWWLQYNFPCAPTLRFVNLQATSAVAAAAAAAARGGGSASGRRSSRGHVHGQGQGSGAQLAFVLSSSGFEGTEQEQWTSSEEEEDEEDDEDESSDADEEEVEYHIGRDGQTIRFRPAPEDAARARRLRRRASRAQLRRQRRQASFDAARALGGASPTLTLAFRTSLPPIFSLVDDGAFVRDGSACPSSAGMVAALTLQHERLRDRTQVQVGDVRLLRFAIESLLYSLRHAHALLDRLQWSMHFLGTSSRGPLSVFVGAQGDVSVVVAVSARVEHEAPPPTTAHGRIMLQRHPAPPAQGQPVQLLHSSTSTSTASGGASPTSLFGVSDMGVNTVLLSASVASVPLGPARTGVAPDLRVSHAPLGAAAAPVAWLIQRSKMYVLEMPLDLAYDAMRVAGERLAPLPPTLGEAVVESLRQWDARHALQHEAHLRRQQQQQQGQGPMRSPAFWDEEEEAAREARRRRPSSKARRSATATATVAGESNGVGVSTRADPSLIAGAAAFFASNERAAVLARFEQEALESAAEAQALLVREDTDPRLGAWDEGEMEQRSQSSASLRRATAMDGSAHHDSFPNALSPDNYFGVDEQGVPSRPQTATARLQSAAAPSATAVAPGPGSGPGASSSSSRTSSPRVSLRSRIGAVGDVAAASAAAAAASAAAAARIGVTLEPSYISERLSSQSYFEGPAVRSVPSRPSVSAHDGAAASERSAPEATSMPVFVRVGSSALNGAPRPVHAYGPRSPPLASGPPPRQQQRPGSALHTARSAQSTPVATAAATAVHVDMGSKQPDPRMRPQSRSRSSSPDFSFFGRANTGADESQQAPRNGASATHHSPTHESLVRAATQLEPQVQAQVQTRPTRPQSAHMVRPSAQQQQRAGAGGNASTSGSALAVLPAEAVLRQVASAASAAAVTLSSRPASAVTGHASPVPAPASVTVPADLLAMAAAHRAATVADRDASHGGGAVAAQLDASQSLVDDLASGSSDYAPRPQAQRAQSAFVRRSSGSTINISGGLPKAASTALARPSSAVHSGGVPAPGPGLAGSASSWSSAGPASGAVSRMSMRSDHAWSGGTPHTEEEEEEDQEEHEGEEEQDADAEAGDADRSSDDEDSPARQNDADPSNQSSEQAHLPDDAHSMLDLTRTQSTTTRLVSSSDPLQPLSFTSLILSSSRGASPRGAYGAPASGVLLPPSSAVVSIPPGHPLSFNRAMSALEVEQAGPQLLVELCAHGGCGTRLYAAHGAGCKLWRCVWCKHAVYCSSGCMTEDWLSGVHPRVCTDAQERARTIEARVRATNVHGVSQGQGWCDVTAAPSSQPQPQPPPHYRDRNRSVSPLRPASSSAFAAASASDATLNAWQHEADATREWVMSDLNHPSNRSAQPGWDGAEQPEAFSVHQQLPPPPPKDSLAAAMAELAVFPAQPVLGIRTRARAASAARARARSRSRSAAAANGARSEAAGHPAADTPYSAYAEQQPLPSARLSQEHQLEQQRAYAVMLDRLRGSEGEPAPSAPDLPASSRRPASASAASASHPSSMLHRYASRLTTALTPAALVAQGVSTHGSNVRSIAAPYAPPASGRRPHGGHKLVAGSTRTGSGATVARKGGGGALKPRGGSHGPTDAAAATGGEGELHAHAGERIGSAPLHYVPLAPATTLFTKTRSSALSATKSSAHARQLASRKEAAAAGAGGGSVSGAFIRGCAPRYFSQGGVELDLYMRLASAPGGLVAPASAAPPAPPRPAQLVIPLVSLRQAMAANRPKSARLASNGRAAMPE